MPTQTLRYAYFPGCVAQGACRELYQSTAALTQALGIELLELKKAACCGSGTYKEDSQLLEDTVNARNIALAESLNLPLLTHCSTCQGVIGRADERLKEAQQTDPAYLERVNGLLAREGCSPYRGTTEVKHLLWALVGDYGLDALQERVTRSLTGLKCAAFYGCYLLRAQQSIPFDNPFQPESMENVFRTVGNSGVLSRQNAVLRLAALELRDRGVVYNGGQTHSRGDRRRSRLFGYALSPLPPQPRFPTAGS
jgi:succinate dehydrogenase / fumarate reductase, cytochrome b subunit